MMYGHGDVEPGSLRGDTVDLVEVATMLPITSSNPYPLFPKRARFMQVEYQRGGIVKVIVQPPNFSSLPYLRILYVVMVP